MPKFITIGGIGIADLEFADGRKINSIFSGNALYSAAGMYVWNTNIGIVGLIGANYPQEVLDRLIEYGIDVNGICRKKSSSDFRLRTIYDEEGKRVYEPPRGILGFLKEHMPGLLAKISVPIWRSLVPQAKDIPTDYLKADGAMVCVSEFRTQTDIIEKLHNRVDTIVMDLTGQVMFPHGTIPNGLANLSIPDYILPSEQELIEYFGDNTLPMEGIEKLISMGARNVAVKIGDKGSIVYDKRLDKWVNVPVFQTDIIDVTGAGDAYGGGFIVGLVETGDPVQAAMYGTVSASFVIEGYDGLHALKYTRKEAEKRLKQVKELMANTH